MLSAANSRISSSFTPRMTTMFIFKGPNPALSAAAMPASTRASSPPRVIRAKVSGLRESRLMLSRATPARRRGRASSSNCSPFVVRTSSLNPGMPESRSRKGTSPFLTRGSPPVTLIFSIPWATQALATRNSSS